MARHKSFGGGKSASEFEPLTFDIDGVSFTPRPALPGTALLEFIRDADDEEGNSAKALYVFLERALVPDEYKRLREVLDSPDRVIDIADIGEIVSWLIEEYSARPTQPSGNSETGQ